MRIEERKIYKFQELSEDAKKRAIEKYRESNDDIFWQSEIFDSFKAIFEHSNIKIRDYSLGLCSRSIVKFDIEDQIGDLSGVRALAWLENNLLYKLRISRSEYLKKRKAYLSYGSEYRIGKIKPCPFTGVCYDETFLESLIEDLKSGSTIKEAYSSLADTYEKILQSEYDHQNSEDYISEHLTVNDYEFLETGSCL
jgi:hypothetical protein